jgi:hypothetical protein
VGKDGKKLKRPLNLKPTLYHKSSGKDDSKIMGSLATTSSLPVLSLGSEPYFSPFSHPNIQL